MVAQRRVGTAHINTHSKKKKECTLKEKKNDSVLHHNTVCLRGGGGVCVGGALQHCPRVSRAVAAAVHLAYVPTAVIVIMLCAVDLSKYSNTGVRARISHALTLSGTGLETQSTTMNQFAVI